MKKILNFNLLLILSIMLAFLCPSCASYQSVSFKSAPAAYDSFYLKELPYVDGDNIGLLGFSHGGWTGLRTAQKNFPDSVNMEAIPFKAAVLFYPSCYYANDQYIAIPNLILIGSKDDWTFAHRCEELDKVFSDPELLELIVYEGAYHDFDRQEKGYRTYLGHVLKYDVKATKDAKERTKSFFDKHLLGT